MTPLQPEGYPLRSYLIYGAEPRIETARLLLADWADNPEHIVTMQVFEVHHEGRTHLCAWAGGTIERGANGQPAGMVLTTVGKGAVEALVDLPGRMAGLAVVELRVGKTPLVDKVRERLREAGAEGVRFVFVGDMAGELDGLMSPLFNLVGIKELQEDGTLVERERIGRAVPGVFKA